MGNIFEMLKERNKTILILLTIVIVFIGWILLRLLSSGSQFTTQNENGRVMRELLSKIDSVSDYSKYSVGFQDDISLDQLVAKMPKLSLSTADSDWFSDDALLSIGVALGFDDKAVLDYIGDNVVWTQDNSTVTIDRQVGLIQYSHALNLSKPTLPKGVIPPKVALDAFSNFIEETGLPTTFLDLESATCEYYGLNEDGIVSPITQESDAQLCKFVLPYLVSGVSTVLPEESYLLVDSKGVIHSMNLFVPNITQQEGMFNLLSWEKAKQQVEDGQAVVVDISNNVDTELFFDSVELVYYMNRGVFRSIDSVRVFEPLYIFSGNDGSVAVSAVR